MTANQHNGYLLIDKPCGWSSFDCVNYIKKKYRLKKAGHAGSLDPIASGLLIIMLNEATKFFDKFQEFHKIYIAQLLLGVSFDTLDITGTPLEFKPPKEIPTKIQIIETLKSFEGEFDQTPPLFSALKINGKSAYKFARRGIEKELTSRKVYIENIELLSYNFPYISLQVSCKKGLYVRSLCFDIAKKLNTIGVLTSLRRIGQFNHDIGEARKMNELPEILDKVLNI